MKAAQRHPSLCNDRLLFNIFNKTSFKQMVKSIVQRTYEDKITGIVVYPLVTSSNFYFCYNVFHEVTFIAFNSRQWLGTKLTKYVPNN